MNVCKELANKVYKQSSKEVGKNVFKKSTRKYAIKFA